MWKIPSNLKQLDSAALIKTGFKIAKMPLTWVVVVAVITFIVIYQPVWQRKSDLMDVLKRGSAVMICLSHENSIFERRSMSKTYATTKRYIRFDRETFITDYLKRDRTSIAFLAVVVDGNRNLYWSEMTKEENLRIANKLKIELGTCIKAPNTHFDLPGAVLVTN